MKDKSNFNLTNFFKPKLKNMKKLMILKGNETKSFGRFPGIIGLFLMVFLAFTTNDASAQNYVSKEVAIKTIDNYTANVRQTVVSSTASLTTKELIAYYQPAFNRILAQTIAKSANVASGIDLAYSAWSQKYGQNSQMVGILPDLRDNAKRLLTL